MKALERVKNLSISSIKNSYMDKYNKKQKFGNIATDWDNRRNNNYYNREDRSISPSQKIRNKMEQMKKSIFK